MGCTVTHEQEISKLIFKFHKAKKDADHFRESYIQTQKKCSKLHSKLVHIRSRNLIHCLIFLLVGFLIGAYCARSF